MTSASGRAASQPGANAGAGTLAILAGGGMLPLRVARAAHAAGRPVFIFGFNGHAEKDIEQWPHVWLGIGEGGKLFRLLKQNDCGELVIIGGIRRPVLKEIKLDWGAMKRLPRIIAMFLGGDDHLLGTLIGILEETGVKVVGAHQIAPDLVLAPGKASRRKPARRDLDDIAMGRKVLAALGPYDVGQGVVVDRGHVIAVEGAEGTDAMLARCAELRKGRPIKGTGVLVKAPKAGQELRVDLPTIGDRTVEAAAAAGLAGIAAEAGNTLVADRKALAGAADRLGLFVTGFCADGD